MALVHRATLSPSKQEAPLTHRAAPLEGESTLTGRVGDSGATGVLASLRR